MCTTPSENMCDSRARSTVFPCHYTLEPNGFIARPDFTLRMMGRLASSIKGGMIERRARI
jgi:hypothetical protein